MNVAEFEQLARKRCSVRQFKADIVPHELLERLLRVSQLAPTAFNLQPTHYYVIRQRQHKESILKACMGQPQTLSAPALIVFAGDRHVAENNFEKVYQKDCEVGYLSEERKDTYRLMVDMSFSHKPLGFGWLTKAICAPFIRFFTPLPELPAVHKRAWLYKQISLNAMTFVLAAESAGLGTCIMEWIDESRLKRTLGIPHQFVIPFVVAVGYPAEHPPSRERLPLEDVAHWM